MKSDKPIKFWTGGVEDSTQVIDKRVLLTIHKWWDLLGYGHKKTLVSVPILLQSSPDSDREQ